MNLFNETFLCLGTVCDIVQPVLNLIGITLSYLLVSFSVGTDHSHSKLIVKYNIGLRTRQLKFK